MMICPDCKVKMIDISYQYPDVKKYLSGKWTEEDAIYKHEEYFCLNPNCKIRWVNDPQKVNKWIVPPQLAITPKQSNAIWNCYNRLDISEEERPVTKKQAKAFLDKYMGASLEAMSQGLVTDKYNLEIERQREEAKLTWLQENSN